MADIYRTLDESAVTAKHWVTVLTAGMGFFADAYDLFIIGTVTAILTPIWHLSTSQLSLLNSASLLASVGGAVLFGKLIDRLGRKAVYGAEVSMLTLGAVLSAFAWGFWPLLVFRLVVGVGIGGDYATSGVITAEYANRKDRGRLIGTVFAMQGFGLLAGPAVASLLLGIGVSHDLAWRLMLGLGALPAVSVVYLRRRIRETPRYALDVQGDLAGAASTVAWTTGIGVTPDAPEPALRCLDGPDDVPAAGEPTAHTPVVVELGASAAMEVPDPLGEAASTPSAPRPRLVSAPFLRRLIGAAGCWFLLDIAFYGNSISSPLILKALQPHGSLLSHTLLSGAIFLVAAVPGYWVAVGLLDRLGRRRIQWQGFAVMAVAFGALALIPGAIHNTWLFLVLFGLSYFFIEFGPNMTTFVYPTELFPTSLRGSGDGISAASGKFGAFLGALVVPHLLAAFGLGGVMGVMACVSVIGLLLTVVALPEPRGQRLDELVGDALTVERAGSPVSNRWAPPLGSAAVSWHGDQAGPDPDRTDRSGLEHVDWPGAGQDAVSEVSRARR